MNSFWKPDNFSDADNSPRKAGFELEFGNISARRTGRILRDRFGGEIKEINPFHLKLENSSLGNIKIERDADVLTSTKYRKFIHKIDPQFSHSQLLKEIEDGIDKLSSFVIPCEIVTEPLLFEDFPKLDQIVEILNLNKVQGTQDSLLNAFGLHINPSVPDLTPDTVLSFIQSFILLEEWLIEFSDIDVTRRYFTNYIDPFPQDYCDIALNKDYTPDKHELIDDYMHHNPTRNRALDFLPILSEIDYKRVLSKLKPAEKNLVSSRPAFHYRLPNCKVGDLSWKISDEWNRWWYVEQIASNKDLRIQLLEKWHLNRSSFSLNAEKDWIEDVAEFLSSNIKTPQ